MESAVRKIVKNLSIVTYLQIEQVSGYLIGLSSSRSKFGKAIFTGIQEVEYTNQCINTIIILLSISLDIFAQISFTCIHKNNI